MSFGYNPSVKFCEFLLFFFHLVLLLLLLLLSGHITIRTQNCCVQLFFLPGFIVPPTLLEGAIKMFKPHKSLLHVTKA